MIARTRHVWPHRPCRHARDNRSQRSAGDRGCALRRPDAPPPSPAPYEYAILIWMKKTLHIDEQLLREARSASGARTDTDTVRLGLEALVRHAAYQRLRALRGSEPRAPDVPRRRERGIASKHSAA